MKPLDASGAETLIIGHVGACGSGKTYRLKLRVATALRSGWQGCFIIADVLGEWPMREGTQELGPLLHGSPALLIRRCSGVPRVEALAPGSVVVCRPRQSDRVDDAATSAWADRLCEVAMRRKDCIVVAPEVWRYAREHHEMPRHLKQLAHEHRHARAGIWWDSQSFAEVKKELVKRTGWIWIHGTGAYQDLKFLESMGGKHLPEAVKDAQRRNCAGSSGHHVMFRLSNPMPPYVVRGPSGEALATYG